MAIPLVVAALLIGISGGITLGLVGSAERRRTDGDAHFPRLGDGGVGDVSDLEIVGRVRAGGGENAGAHYGRNVGVTICSVPIVGIG